MIGPSRVVAWISLDTSVGISRMTIGNRKQAPVLDRGSNPYFRWKFMCTLACHELASFCSMGSEII
jgi:hypothetical protein